MKTKKVLYIAIILCSVISISFNLSACKKDSSSSSSTSTTKTDCIVGVWSATEYGFTKTFTFKSDKTGIEVQSASDTREFIWQIKDGNPTIIYVGDTTEWKFTLDCDKNELTVLGLVYKK